ncbi:Coronin-like protein crn1 [Mycoemilia scoparia]|uniref:Coronin n=1 Tax=Mycoemilia scoparia TaxID=417184 RepID=A0A9W8DUH2_9FUNG|nr:Coronin-like protein crn1 [Mycoemilia scoparia]
MNFVRPSKYRHVYGTPAKRDAIYENLRITTSATDSNYVSLNPLFMAVNWNTGGGGGFTVIPLPQTGKLSTEFPVFTGHGGPVIDTQFSPFDDHIVASGAEDSKIMTWRVPDNLADEDQAGKVHDTPLLTLDRHGRKVAHVRFNPIAENVLASSSHDQTIKLWDINYGAERETLRGFKDVIQSIDWSWDGSLVVATCRDKRIRTLDPRSGKIAQEGPCHQGIKGSRVVWMGDADRVATTGFSRTSEREIFLWDTKDLSKPLKTVFVDTSAGLLMPTYDPGCKVLYVGGKGDGNIRYYEYADDDLYFLSEYQSIDPQRGLGAMPKYGVNVAKCEVARFYKVTNTYIEPISFRVPRKSDAFQSDIFPDTQAPKPALTSEEYFNGVTRPPIMMSMEELYNNGYSSVSNTFSTPVKSADNTPTPDISPAAPAAPSAGAAVVSASTGSQNNATPTPPTADSKAIQHLEELNGKYEELSKQFAAVNKEKDSLEKQLEDTAINVKSLENKLADEKLEHNKTKDEIQSLKLLLETKEKDYDALNRQLEVAKSTCNDAKQEAERSQALEKRVKDLEFDLSKASKAAKDLVEAVEKSFGTTN